MNNYPNNFDKPYKTIEEQIDLLSSRGLIFNDKELAMQHLKTKGYYHLVNAYKSVFLDPNQSEERFKENVEFDELVSFYYFDETLKNILFKYIILFENTFKNAIGSCLSSKYGVSMDQYLDPTHFNNRTGKVSSILERISVTKDTNKYPTKHYRETKNHIPFWVLSRNITFGMAQMLYSIFLPDDKESVMRMIFNYDPIEHIAENEVENLKKFLDLIIDITLDFRNNIAHNGNLVTYRSRQSLTRNGVKLMWTQDVFTRKTWTIENVGKNDTYALLISIMSGLSCSQFDRLNFIFEIRNNFLNRYNNSNFFDDYIKAVGLPSDLYNIIEAFK